MCNILPYPPTTSHSKTANVLRGSDDTRCTCSSAHSASSSCVAQWMCYKNDRSFCPVQDCLCCWKFFLSGWQVRIVSSRTHLSDIGIGMKRRLFTVYIQYSKVRLDTTTKQQNYPTTFQIMLTVHAPAEND